MKNALHSIPRKASKNLEIHTNFLEFYIVLFSQIKNGKLINHSDDELTSMYASFIHIFYRNTNKIYPLSKEKTAYILDTIYASPDFHVLHFIVVLSSAILLAAKE